MNRRIITNTERFREEEDIHFYILGDTTGRWLLGAGGHPDATSIDTSIGRYSPFQAQLMVNHLVLMLI